MLRSQAGSNKYVVNSLTSIIWHVINCSGTVYMSDLDSVLIALCLSMSMPLTVMGLSVSMSLIVVGSSVSLSLTVVGLSLSLSLRAVGLCLCHWQLGIVCLCLWLLRVCLCVCVTDCCEFVCVFITDTKSCGYMSVWFCLFFAACRVWTRERHMNCLHPTCPTTTEAPRRSYR